MPVGRVRAIRVVEGVFRRPFGLCALTVEVTGYADEASAARTLFPLVRVSEVRAFLEEFLPELADDPGDLARPPRRAARRYLLPTVLLGAVLTFGAWWLVGPYSLIVLALFAAYGYAEWRAAGWRVREGRLAIRSLRIARVTVLAPTRLRERQTVAQNLLQRRAGLADLSVAFGKTTTARIRHLEAADARSALFLEQAVANGRVAELQAGRDRAGREAERAVERARRDAGQRAAHRADVQRPARRGRSASGAKFRSRIGTRAPPLTVAVSWRRNGSM